jgi:hypothetical protein
MAALLNAVDTESCGPEGADDAYQFCVDIGLPETLSPREWMPGYRTH